MFYLEVMLESTGGVKDVRIHHEGKVEQQVSLYQLYQCCCVINLITGKNKNFLVEFNDTFNASACVV
jgi:hypothetical protein